MANVFDSLWVEKYRPKKLEDVVLDPGIRNTFEEYIRNGDIPNLLFSGKPGTGKTTIAKILLHTLNADTMIMNSSSDRGIDVVRNKFTNFMAIRGSHKWRIILCEEADGLTPEAQQAMRNVMEECAGRGRCILTCNYLNKIIEPIRSRCQFIEFKEVPRKACFKQLQGILGQEKVKHDTDTVLGLVDAYYPDMRAMINAMQLSTTGKVLKEIREDLNENILVMKLIKEKNMNGLREIAYRLDHIQVFRYLFDNIGEIEQDNIKQTEKRLRIAEYMARDSYVADHEINFMACCLEMMQSAKENM
jgi:replication factor C small subunit